MDVILLERVQNLGQIGDVVKVKPGYARNFLLPTRKALRATEANKAKFESQRAQIEAMNLEKRSEAEGVKHKVDGLKVVLIRQAGETGQLFGSVNGRDIADAITASGFTVERRQIILDRPIKTLGLHPIRVALHPEVIVGVTANVGEIDRGSRSPGEGRRLRRPRRGRGGRSRRAARRSRGGGDAGRGPGGRGRRARGKEGQDRAQGEG